MPKFRPIIKTQAADWDLKCMVCQQEQATMRAELSEHPGFYPVVCGDCSGLTEDEIFNRAFETEG